MAWSSLPSSLCQAPKGFCGGDAILAPKINECSQHILATHLTPVVLPNNLTVRGVSKRVS